jgi:hypothetical protein
MKKQNKNFYNNDNNNTNTNINSPNSNNVHKYGGLQQNIMKQNISVPNFYYNPQQTQNMYNNIQFPHFQNNNTNNPPPQKSFLVVSIKLANEEKVIHLNKNDDLYKKAAEFCIRNNLNDSLIKPIYDRIIKAWESIEQVLSHDINTQELKHLDSIKEKYEDYVNNQDILEYQQNLSCITVFGVNDSTNVVENNQICNLSF